MNRRTSSIVYILPHHTTVGSDEGYSRWKTEQATQAARDATEANQAVTDWGTFWYEHTDVTVSSMLLAVHLALTGLPPQQMGYGQHLLTEGIKVLRDPFADRG